MFCIETEKLKLKLEIVPVSSLLIHEEVIPQSARKLIMEFKNLVSLQNPIIVDENHVVLDGNHRAHAFKVLKHKFIPVCKIDYFTRHTKLLYWFRLLSNVKRPDLLKKVIASAGGTFHRISDRTSLKKALEENCLACGIQSGKEYLYVGFPEEAAGVDYAFANSLELDKNGITTGRIDEPVITNDTKKDILEFIMSNENIKSDQVIAVGDGSQSSHFIENVGLSIAIKPEASHTKSDGVISSDKVLNVLYCLGISKEELEKYAECS